MGNCESDSASSVGNDKDIMMISTAGANKTARKNNLIPGIRASHEMAKYDLPKISKYSHVIKKVAMEKNLDPALIAAIISRESRGEVIEKQWDTEWFLSKEMERLVSCIESMRMRYPSIDKKQQLKGAIAAYNINKVHDIRKVDEYTSNGDYSNDVVARAQWYNMHGGF